MYGKTINSGQICISPNYVMYLSTFWFYLNVLDCIKIVLRDKNLYLATVRHPLLLPIRIIGANTPREYLSQTFSTKSYIWYTKYYFYIMIYTIIVSQYTLCYCVIPDPLWRRRIHHQISLYLLSLVMLIKVTVVVVVFYCYCSRPTMETENTSSD